ncbi:MAG TPA: transglutaminase-like domain-containing protein [Mycobacteriales bacterium]|nr:transglutaminase-like domain-containing protein [Mycobacteriales bacterium]
MTAQSRRLFAEVVRADEVDLALACLLIGAEVRPDLDVAESLAHLDQLAADALATVTSDAPAYDVAVGLRAALGDAAGFRGYSQDYGDLRASLLHEVLRRRRGLPILLSVVYLEVGRRLGVAVRGIGLPGHFLVGVAGSTETVLLDPFYGGRLTDAAELAARVEEVLGGTEQLTDASLKPWSSLDILTRILGNIRASSTSNDTLRTRLWAVELSMLIPHHSVSLRRERGELLARLGDYVGAAQALEDYASVISPLDPSAAELSLRQARLVRSRLS